MKKAIIVGATSGTGKGFAKLLADDEYKVGITGRRTNLLTELKNENPGSYIIKSFDITDTNIISQQLEELVNELGGLDLCSGVRTNKNLTRKNWSSFLITYGNRIQHVI